MATKKKTARGKKKPACPTCERLRDEYLEEHTFLPEAGGPRLAPPIILDPDGLMRCINHGEHPAVAQMRTTAAKYAQQGRTINNLRREVEGLEKALARRKKGAKYFKGGLGTPDERRDLREDILEKLKDEKDVSKLNLARQLLIDQAGDDAKSGNRKPWGKKFLGAVAAVRRVYLQRIDYLEGLLRENGVEFEEEDFNNEDDG